MPTIRPNTKPATKAVRTSCEVVAAASICHPLGNVPCGAGLSLSPAPAFPRRVSGRVLAASLPLLLLYSNWPHGLEPVRRGGLALETRRRLAVQVRRVPLLALIHRFPPGLRPGSTSRDFVLRRFRLWAW